MTELHDVARPDGQTCPAYIAQPSGQPRGGLVVVQEWWGLNEQIKETADRFAAEGFLALVPDLYRGKLATDADEASHMMGHLDFIAAAKQDIRGALMHLKKNGCGKAGVTGFCMGGALTLLSAMHVAEMDAGVVYYGIPPAEAGDPSTIQIPLQLHFGLVEDDWCTPSAIDALEQKLKDGSVDHELYRYQAKHAFMNDKRPEVYDAASAKQAWDRTVAFFKTRLS